MSEEWRDTDAHGQPGAVGSRRRGNMAHGGQGVMSERTKPSRGCRSCRSGTGGVTFDTEIRGEGTEPVRLSETPKAIVLILNSPTRRAIG